MVSWNLIVFLGWGGGGMLGPGEEGTLHCTGTSVCREPLLKVHLSKLKDLWAKWLLLPLLQVIPFIYFYFLPLFKFKLWPNILTLQSYCGAAFASKQNSKLIISSWLEWNWSHLDGLGYIVFQLLQIIKTFLFQHNICVPGASPTSGAR